MRVTFLNPVRPSLMRQHYAQGNRVTWKSNFFLKIIHLQDDCPKGFVGAANVGSKQMQRMHVSLRGKAAVLMGKNTMSCKASEDTWKTTQLRRTCCLTWGNVGFVSTKEDLTGISGMMLANRVSAAACAEQQWKPRLQEDKWQTQRLTGLGGGHCTVVQDSSY